MAETKVKGRDVGDTSIYREDLNTSISGKAVITKILEKANSGIKLSSSTGADPGTGDVELILDPSVAVDEAAPYVLGFSASGVPVKKTAFANTIQNRIVQIKVNSSAISVGTGKAKIFIPVELNNARLTAAEACLVTPSTSGLPTIDIYNFTTGFSMLSTQITIDANENTSYTAATRPVINTASSRDLVTTGTIVGVNINGAGNGAAELSVILTFTL